MNDKKNKMFGIIGTVLFHVILIVILVLSAFKAPEIEFPEPYGIAITFGEEIKGDGEIKSEEIAPQPQEEQVPQQSNSSASADDVVTNDNSNAISVKKSTKPNETKPELTAEEKQKLEQEKAAEEKRQQQQQLANKNFSGNPGNGDEGKDDGKAGDIQGNPNSKNKKGTPGNPLGNKDAKYLAKPLNTTNCNKPIELTVKINSQGTVVAITDIETALSEQSCIEAAKTAAKQNRFESDPSREVRYAKITYDYTVSKQ